MPIVSSNYTIGDSLTLTGGNGGIRTIKADPGRWDRWVTAADVIKHMPSNIAVLASLFDELEELKGEMFLKYYDTDLDFTGRLAKIIRQYKEELHI